MREKMTNTCNKCACNKVCNHDVFGFENCGNFIPAEDVVEVIRCKDCKYYSPYGSEGCEGLGECLYCLYLLGLEFCVEDKFFCSYGERREGEQNGL